MAGPCVPLHAGLPAHSRQLSHGSCGECSLVWRSRLVPRSVFVLRVQCDDGHRRPLPARRCAGLTQRIPLCLWSWLYPWTSRAAQSRAASRLAKPHSGNSGLYVAARNRPSTKASSSVTREREYEGLTFSQCSLASPVMGFSVAPLSPCTQAGLDIIANSLNNRPRATHAFHSPLEVFAAVLSAAHQPLNSNPLRQELRFGLETVEQKPYNVKFQPSSARKPHSAVTRLDAAHSQNRAFLSRLPFPGELTQIDLDSVADCILHFFTSEENSPAHNILVGGVRLIIKNRESETVVNLRNVLKTAGYGFSSLYKRWSSSEELFKDIWMLSVKSYMASELEHLRQLGRGSPDSFINIWVTHAVLAQKLVPPSLFSMVVKKFFDNDVLQMLDHIPGHVGNVLDLYDDFFGEDPSTPKITDPLRKSLTNSLDLVGCYLFTRNCKPRDAGSDQATIESIKNLVLYYLSPRT